MATATVVRSKVGVFKWLRELEACRHGGDIHADEFAAGRALSQTVRLAEVVKDTASSVLGVGPTYDEDAHTIMLRHGQVEGLMGRSQPWFETRNS
jgi:hypothetical protein